MIDLAQDPTADTAGANVPTSLSPIIPDAAKTQEVVTQEGNFEVHQQTAPEPVTTRSMDVTKSTQAEDDAVKALPVSQVSADDYAAAAQAPVTEVPAAFVDAAVAAVEKANPSDDAPVTEKGVDLSALLQFNEKRSANPQGNRPKGPKKPQGQGNASAQPRKEGQAKPAGGGGQTAKAQQQSKQPKAAPKPALLRSAKAGEFLREAMGVAREASEDGVHHINTSSMGKTPLGRALDMNARQPFNHPDLGQFASVGGLWYYVAGEKPDEQFRELADRAVRNRGSKVRQRNVAGFRTIIADATWIKIRSDEALSIAMAQNPLPYRCYFTTGELQLPQEMAMSDWYMPVLEEIAATLRRFYEGENEAVPNFEFLERPVRREERDRQPRRPQR